jgi:hypothetical protein
MDALGVLLMGVGGFLLYASIKDEHPWTLFTSVLTGAQAGVPGSGVEGPTTGNTLDIANDATVAPGNGNPTNVGSGSKAA